MPCHFLHQLLQTELAVCGLSLIAGVLSIMCNTKGLVRNHTLVLDILVNSAKIEESSLLVATGCVQ
jgi:hypothetical protein